MMKSGESLLDEWRSMQRRIVDHLREPRSSDLADAPMRLPGSVYTDPLRFEAERKKVFTEQPLLVGLSGDLPEPGDRLVFDAAGPPVLVVRGRDGEIRAFLNLCSHRGGRLVESCERSRRLTCPFHSWSFDLEGRLATLPQEQSFEGLDRASLGLVALPVEEWKGMIFVKASPGGDIDVETFLGPMAPLLAALDLASLERVCADRFELDSNWKIALDTFCETYHVPALHRDSLSRNLIPYVAIFDHYGRHHRYSGPGVDFEELVDTPESDWPAGGYQAVHYLFPNTTFAYTHAFDGKTPVVSMFQLFPGESVGRSVTLGSTYRRKDAPDASDELIAEMHGIVLDVVLKEDYRVARNTWESLSKAPPDFEVSFGRAEALLHHYHRDLAELTGMALS
ncbi:MAG: aromatic ring-hydroxylating dioxygenase subunit alpha [Deltaproteobacteria bacterium]|jgi:nitrite reductase/ring-hydroxylating ferredoxin subunit|nr:aromatic ring-hydroxylating dioxygenase subunit alpha [Deltaproteobacteria bacterium]